MDLFFTFTQMCNEMCNKRDCVFDDYIASTAKNCEMQNLYFKTEEFSGTPRYVGLTFDWCLPLPDLS